MSRPPDVLAIDGPSGSGKGTVAQAMAARLGWWLLDSGALYRVVGLLAIRRGTNLADADALAAMARELDVTFANAAVTVNGADETDAIRDPEVDTPASKVATLATVRAELLTIQRGRRRPPGLVADGRDMGTVVFPDARLKIFLTASAEIRAERRYRQLKARGAGVSLSALLEGIRERDERDRKRAVSPLVPAPDAVTIDSSGMSIHKVVAAVMTLATKRGFVGNGGSVE